MPVCQLGYQGTELCALLEYGHIEKVEFVMYERKPQGVRNTTVTAFT